MRALPRHPREANSTPLFKTSEYELSNHKGMSIDSDVLLPEELCPLKRAIRDQLCALGASVSQIQQLILSGQLKHAEDAFGNIIGRLREQYCPSETHTCTWVREGHQDPLCDLLDHQQTPYLHSISTPRATARNPKNPSDGLKDRSTVCDPMHGESSSKTTSSVLDQLVEQALRF